MKHLRAGHKITDVYKTLVKVRIPQMTLMFLKYWHRARIKKFNFCRKISKLQI